MAALAVSVTAQAADFVTMGDPGNAADRGYGAVGYTYQISKTEVTVAEMAASGAGDGDENYWNDGPRTVGTGAPASYVSLYEAMKYCNYLTSGNINSGYYSSSDGGATYQANALSHDVYAAANGITYFVPTEDEWYKAAYYNLGTDTYSVYADGTSDTDNPPTKSGGVSGWNYDYVNSSPNYTRDVTFGTAEQNGTVNMMGNVYEWTESEWGGDWDEIRVHRGASYLSTEVNLRSTARTGGVSSMEDIDIGFRVVAVPEPASALMISLGALLITGYRRFFRYR